ncbi:hypothetical protein C0993_009540, partial [Termitomyces sp. T159_Od127]
MFSAPPPSDALETHGHVLFANGKVEKNSATHGLPRLPSAATTVRRRPKLGKAANPIPVSSASPPPARMTRSKKKPVVRLLPIISDDDEDGGVLLHRQGSMPVPVPINISKVPATPSNGSDAEDWNGISASASPQLILEASSETNAATKELMAKEKASAQRFLQNAAAGTLPRPKPCPKKTTSLVRKSPTPAARAGLIMTSTPAQTPGPMQTPTIVPSPMQMPIVPAPAQTPAITPVAPAPMQTLIVPAPMQAPIMPAPMQTPAITPATVHAPASMQSPVLTQSPTPSEHAGDGATIEKLSPSTTVPSITAARAFLSSKRVGDAESAEKTSPPKKARLTPDSTVNERNIQEACGDSSVEVADALQDHATPHINVHQFSPSSNHLPPPVITVSPPLPHAQGVKEVRVYPQYAPPPVPMSTRPSPAPETLDSLATKQMFGGPMEPVVPLTAPTAGVHQTALAKYQPPGNY